ncbi:RagB/SusD family nutrient uptake outer membrane protein [Sediminitomix flava]|uniref:Putative outer membrane starch-binding protein n=1 Tax=Sediminitomix flava TaxID=379075 RepID=A0A315YY07_SEDFL|nr:RagB/SusD family nutrient uptake outer membrane protein [Sediminitomix flava]PWJ35012.1 putative outer membrane starch-binding protein [Sediminitomix flava]
MKTLTKYIYLVGLLIGFSSCTEYLEEPDNSLLNEELIFGNYAGYQGFLDEAYYQIPDLFDWGIVGSPNWADHTIAKLGWGVQVAMGDNGLYRNNANSASASQHNFMYYNPNNRSEWDEKRGVWYGSIKGIRVANLAIDKIDQLVEATEEEKNYILGQAYFFRAFFHFELMQYYGGVPYVDKALTASDDQFLPRLSFKECAEKVVADFDEALKFLPETRPANEYGRIVKGMALGWKAKTLLFAASPWVQPDKKSYDLALAEEAAKTSLELIALGQNTGMYGLLPKEDYEKIWVSLDGNYPHTKEVIFFSPNHNTNSGQGYFANSIGRRFFPNHIAHGNRNAESPTQNLVEMFETANGLNIEDDPSWDPNSVARWENRDPRFHMNILHHGVEWIENPNNSRSNLKTLDLWNDGSTGGIDFSISDKSETGYLMRKFWPKGYNRFDDANYTNYRMIMPRLRLAEVYLWFAEAANQVGGPSKSYTVDGVSLTPIEAVNTIRRRIGHVDVHNSYLNQADFTKKIEQERSVELCFEGLRWMDLRRWYKAHLPENKIYRGIAFDQDLTNFREVVHAREKVFDEGRHYWFPFPDDQVQIYPGMSQNPGW